jgi:hypothetical protein
MTDRTETSIDANDVALLLPWYAAGTLSSGRIYKPGSMVVHMPGSKLRH